MIKFCFLHHVTAIHHALFCVLKWWPSDGTIGASRLCWGLTLSSSPSRTSANSSRSMSMEGILRSSSLWPSAMASSFAAAATAGNEPTTKRNDRTKAAGTCSGQRRQHGLTATQLLWAWRTWRKKRREEEDMWPHKGRIAFLEMNSKFLCTNGMGSQRS